MADWFRKTSWTDADQQDFWLHHKRARAFGKAQYLRIQAGHLAGTNEPSLRSAALVLLNLMIAEFPDKFQLASAYHQRAQIYLIENRKEEAISNFRATINQERVFSSVGTYAWLDFGWTVMTRQWTELYDEVLGVLNEREANARFPADHFRLQAIRSIIASIRGDREQARTLAITALVHAQKEHSGLRYHPDIGLVGKSCWPVVDRLEKIRDS